MNQNKYTATEIKTLVQFYCREHRKEQRTGDDWFPSPHNFASWLNGEQQNSNIQVKSEIPTQEKLKALKIEFDAIKPSGGKAKKNER